MIRNKMPGLYGVIVLALLAVFSSSIAAAEQNFRQRLHAQLTSVTTGDDIKVEVEFGKNVAARILGRYQMVSDSQLNRYINLVGGALVLHSSRSEIKYHFAVIESDKVNAYSTPGGYIFVTRGALAAMQDESELAAVLAHEVAHVTEKHIVKSLNVRARDSGAVTGLGRLLGGASETVQVAFQQAVDQAVKLLFEDGYQQQDELDSDRVASLLLATTGYDPLSLKRYLTRVQDADQHGEGDVNTTHPPSQQRLQAIDDLIQQEQLDNLNYPTQKDRFEKYVSIQQSQTNQSPRCLRESPDSAIRICQ